MGKTTFLDNFESSFEGLDRERYEQVAHSVLSHLWRRLPFTERQRLLDAVPEDLRDLITEPRTPGEQATTPEQRFTEGPIETDDILDFLDKVRRETGLEGNNKDQEAVRAVFEAFKAELGDDETARISHFLPTGVKPMWAGA
jgi:uncharacterized protein (DUF2267 family)